MLRPLIGHKGPNDLGAAASGGAMLMWFAIGYLACFAVLLELVDRASDDPWSKEGRANEAEAKPGTLSS